MSKRKYRKGIQITSIDRLVDADFAIVNGKFYCNGWIVSWPVRMAQDYIKRGMAYEAVRLTNEEYYEGRSQKSLMQQFRDDICLFCQNKTESGCTDECCDTAYKKWLKEEVK